MPLDRRGRASPAHRAFARPVAGLQQRRDWRAITSRASRLATLGGIALLAASCGARAVPTSPAVTAAGTRPPDTSPTPDASASASPSSPAPAPLRIGLVAAIVTPEGFVRDPATAEAVATIASQLGAEHEVIVTEEDADYAPNIATFVQHGFSVVVTVGEPVASATVAAARAAPDTQFVGVDQRACLTPGGDPDPTGTCEGDAATLVPNYQAVTFAEADVGYLAGIVAASVSERGVLGVVGGSSVGWVVRSWRSFENGAQSVDPNVDVRYVELAPDASGFGDPVAGRARADELIGGGADVLFQVAGDAGQGVLEGACAAGVRAIGSIADQAAGRPDLGCIVTSAEWRVRDVVASVVRDAASGRLTPGTVVHGLGSDPAGAALSPITGGVTLSSDQLAILNSATRALSAGTLDPCAPIRCTVTGD